MKKVLCLILVFVICLLILPGCGNNATENTAAQPQEENTEPTEQAAPKTYRSRYVELKDGGLTSELKNGITVGDDLYFTSTGVTADNTPDGVAPEWPEQYYSYGPILCKVGLDGSVARIPYTPGASDTDDQETDSVVFEKLCASNSGTLWILEKRTCRGRDGTAIEGESGTEVSSDLHGGERYALVNVAEDGTVVKQFLLDDLGNHGEAQADSGGEYSLDVRGLVQAADGTLCLAVSEWFVGTASFVEENRICLYDPESGLLKNSVSMTNAPEQLASLQDGSVAVSSYEGGSQIVELLDPETGNFDHVIPVKDFIDSMICSRGTEAYPVFYSAGDSLYGLDPMSGEIGRILNWIDCDVARSGTESICVLGDGTIVTTSSRQTGGDTENELILISAEEDNQEAERKTLHMAVMNLYPFTSEMVSRFNRSNSEYRIEVTDYAQYNDYSSNNEEDWYAGITRLETEIIAGNIPDILDISLLSADRLGTKGILEDLYPYLDSDPDLDRSMLQEHVIKAFEENGKLYQTVSNFYILTTAGLSNVVGEKMGWTMQEFHEAFRKLQQENPNCTVFDCYTTRNDVLTFLLYLEMGNYVDWQKGECSFDSDAFLQLLEFVKSFPDSFDWASGNLTPDDLDSDMRLCKGLQLLKQCNFGCFEDVQNNTAGLQGAPCTFVGYPTEAGVGSMFAQFGNALSISTGCADKEAAWQFVRQFFLPDYQEQLKGSVFPTNLSVYEEMKREAMTPQYQRNPDGSYAVNAEGKRIEADLGSILVNGNSYPRHIVTEEEAAILDEIIASTTNILHIDDSLKEIITSGSAPYFSDQKSADEVAKLIQSKANLYVNEQR